MTYHGDFDSSEEYLSKKAGAALEVLLVNEDDPSDVVLGAASSFQFNENFEALPVEEAGKNGVDEIVDGRHTGSASISGFFSPKYGDNLPTRTSFAGRTYIVVCRIAPGRPSAGTVMHACVGTKINSKAFQMGARGLTTFNLGLIYETCYNGTEYADLYGA